MRHPLMCSLPIVLALALLGCQARQAELPALPAWQSSEGRNDAMLGQIRELATGRTLTPAQLVQALATAPRVLVGEKHDNPDHHALERWLLQALQSQRPQGSLLLEMLQPEQQARVDALRGRAQWPEDLPKALAWQDGWSWQLYGPIVRDALRGPQPLLAANLSPDEMRQAYRQQPVLQGERSNAPAVKAALLEEVRAGHCDLLPETQLPAMLVIQQQRDRRMAERLLAAPEPALLLAGSFHARKDLGVPLHLADLGAKGATQVLLLAEVGEPVAAATADYVWYTAAMPAQDYCAGLHRGP
ncbi:ChaN family lipoprotein [Pseudomonas entomophila]|uniref:ChaN family lipoprotein n=1 Tax=Pseudomonas entomophila TaxID=312306 RepID=UPI0023D88B95|nr:ChaN family lipoprotein [Pseudomonas entomophila]MDF0730855.1 ChaN family lipoprotein [Pseudomonas entomophila]